MARIQHTITIKNVSGKLFEFTHDSQIFYLEPDQEWTLDKASGQHFCRKHFRQLREVGEGGIPTPDPIDDPNADKSYRDMHPKKYGANGAVPARDLWCKVCGKQFEKAVELKEHEVVHEVVEEEPEPETVKVEVVSNEYFCKDCKRSFTKPGPFAMHMKTHAKKKVAV